MDVDNEDDKPEDKWDPERENWTQEPWKEWTEEEKADWARQFGTDEEIERKKNQIAEDGLTAKVYLKLGELWEGKRLWKLQLEPIEGQWTHMRRNQEELDDFLQSQGGYHISICFDTDVKTEWQKKAIRFLQENYTDPFEFTFFIASWGGGMTANIKDSLIKKDILELHNFGGFWNRDIHISM